MTLILNLYGGPGVGKSTTAARVFAELKLQHFEVELVTEVAKDFTWEERSDALRCQPYVIGKQIWRMKRLFGKVDVVVTDAPILLGLVYAVGEPPSWIKFLTDTHRRWDTLDVVLTRHDSKRYVERGRNQTFDEARDLDARIYESLAICGIEHVILPGPPHDPVPELVNLVHARLSA